MTEALPGAPRLRERLIAAITPEFREPGPGADPPWTARQKAEQVVDRIFERDPSLASPATAVLRAGLEKALDDLDPNDPHDLNLRLLVTDIRALLAGQPLPRTGAPASAPLPPEPGGRDG